MKRQDLLSIMITATVGFFGGGFLYLVHFSELVNPVSVPTQQATEEFVIISEAYGGCRSVCPAFRLTGNGNYRLQYYTEMDGERLFKDGTLPFELARNLKRALEDEQSLLEQSQETTPEDCHSYSDGIDVRYSITLDGNLYELDSCGTTVAGNGEIWTSLAKIWDYFKTVE